MNTLSHNTTGTQNTANGANALQNNTRGNDNTANGFEALVRNTSGSNNTANGSGALQSNTTGSGNTANGTNALFHNTFGINNTANGTKALFNNNGGGANTASGWQALLSDTTAQNNTAIGVTALQNNTTGSFNVAVGAEAGINLTTGNDNIYIANQGVAGDSGTLRIRNIRQTAAYIQGIYGQTVASGVGVIIDSTGHLGTVKSSAAFKEAIKPMDRASEALLALEPVTFRYKHELDPNGMPQFGLIAEQVEKVNPDLVVKGEDGKVMTVRYDAVNAMLLNEFLKEHGKVEKLETTVARQQKQIDAFSAALQKVSTQLELSKAAPRTVLNNR